MSESRAIEISPYCRRLSSKRASFLDGPPRVESDILDGSGSCWCLRTMMAVGPDAQLVDPEHCRSHRACFEPYARSRPAPQA